MGTELDGSATVKAWGNGRNYFDACEQAKKNAVRDVLFKGIIAGNGECNAHPLVPQVNAQERFETYFNKFFRDGGEYKNFVSLKDERIADKISRHKINTPQGQTHGIVLRILRAELKEKLINDGIIKN
ncbi:hypothetical protein FACS189413_06760 [Bacteroidia bacterium]|nr:hypothetical protein FACS189413_06760 [Bacteroidia bacterium]